MSAWKGGAHCGSHDGSISIGIGHNLAVSAGLPFNWWCRVPTSLIAADTLCSLANLLPRVGVEATGDARGEQ